MLLYLIFGGVERSNRGVLAICVESDIGIWSFCL